MISFENLFSGGLQLYLKNFVPILKIILPLMLVQIATWFVPFETLINKFSPIQVILVMFAISWIVSAWTEQVLISGLYHYLKGEKFPIGEARWRALTRLPSYIALMFIWVVLMILGAVALIFPGIIFFTWFIFLAPVFVLEGKGISSFRRSKELVLERGISIFGRVAGVFLLIVLSMMLLMFVINKFTTLIAPQLASTIVTFVVPLISIALFPLYPAMVVVLYNDVLSGEKKD